jgi:hypothetical protein
MQFEYMPEPSLSIAGQPLSGSNAYNAHSPVLMGHGELITPNEPLQPPQVTLFSVHLCFVCLLFLCIYLFIYFSIFVVDADCVFTANRWL